MATARTLKIAGIQVESRNGDVQGNLNRAEALIAAAAQRGAELALCPELMSAGYLYHRSLWQLAEPRDGPTERFLSRMARQYRMYIGASYLEASDDFFNTLCLMKPDGTVAGRVRKQSLPGFEGWFFRGCSGPKVIETDFGRVGIGICFDNCTSRFLRHLCDARIDLLLMPHSTPRITWGPLTLLGENGRKVLCELPVFYARAFGVPTVLVNKAAGEDSSSPVPCVPFARLRFRFIGQSRICDADGTVCDQLDQPPGIVVADVILDPERKRQPASIPTGYWSQKPALFARTSAAMFQILELAGKTGYALSNARRRAARDIQIDYDSARISCTTDPCTSVKR
jgi:N-carbamoylputrescine amidase